MAVRAKLAEAWVSLDKLKEADAQYSELYKKAQDESWSKTAAMLREATWPWFALAGLPFVSD